MKKLLCGLLILGLTIPSFAQVIKTEELSEVVVYATNYKYLNSIDTQEEASIPVEMLRRKVASFNVKDSEYYQDDYDLYNINFFIPEGKILAAYDKDGKILRTAEKFKNINLPKAVKEAVLDRFPEWTITKDVYLVNYHDKTGVSKKYKLKLENGDKVLRVKVDEKGEFL
ncbi:nicotinate-nucleotide adenylyltransferase [Muricauda sp. JGD-17]|uniref:Nicotinate-nucleotide adenylyltransferase n=1 Tax=Flagellimonas ochracea TaxID=2696472 RepID=A0A964TAL5_9FLAO|nr:nicotinate-nucleotide adenylyltransferase [Allomuricauda ochracea]NAY91325.1 nicotinate-nucleotide adenylyltransferase [Allomuricauda ochracea]